MKFSDFSYYRPSIDEMRNNVSKLINDFNDSTSAEEQSNVIQKLNSIRTDFESMRNIAFIKYSLNTADKNCQDEQDYFDDVTPEYNEIVSDYYKVLNSSVFKDELKLKYGEQLFNVAECTVKTVSPDVVDDLKTENRLSSEYMKLKASAKIQFRGNETNLPDLEPFMESRDRDTRREAFGAYWGFFADNSAEFDRLFDELVKLRTKIARKLGFKNFVELGYARMKRVDYDAEMVANFREQIKKHVVPVATGLRNRQRERIGVDKLMIYDLSLLFPSGNATPKGNPEWIVANGEKMYKELSPTTGEFFDYMIGNDLMDLYSKQGKADMGYCEYIPKYNAPFIFANMNGTEDDITVLTHEAGHAFQSYMSSHFNIKEYFEPSFESAEIHSMSMEFLTWKWMEYFFKEDTEKFKFSHLSGTLSFLPYGVMVDEFQHWVYENPDVTPAERKRHWRELEKVYMPHLNYDGNEYLESGGRWQKQGHIYEMPFYYIDYTLAQICAYQFWKRSSEDLKPALEDYIKLCKAGGSKSFLQLVELAGLKSPFNDSVVESCVGMARDWLKNADDSKF